MKMKHITINTACMEESIKFYQEITGLTVQSDLRKITGMPIVFLANGKDETCIELIENAEKAYKGSGLSIGFEVEDVDAKYEELKAAGFETSPMLSPNPSVKFFFITDPNGVTIQMI